ncbi:DNA cytosine methyltransferase [Rhizobiaceae sp. 2RAB30]
MQAQPGPATGPFHWENRRLSAGELCRLQTFPDGLRFNCSHAEIQKMVGNAVPSALAETLAREVATQIFCASGALTTPTLAPPAQETVPTPARRLPVAKKFLHLVHSDSAHPGTGLGRGAIYRDSEAA